MATAGFSNFEMDLVSKSRFAVQAHAVGIPAQAEIRYSKAFLDAGHRGRDVIQHQDIFRDRFK